MKKQSRYLNQEWDLKKDAENELRELRTKCDEVLQKIQEAENEIDFIKVIFFKFQKDYLYFKQQESNYNEFR